MIFKDNKYTRIYYQLIEKRQIEILLKKDVYCETHHIIPKSLGGNDQVSNLVNLLPREHFMAHLLITKMVHSTDDIVKMNWALHKMCYSTIDHFNSKDYGWYRQRHSKFLKENHHSKRIPGWNQKMREIVTASWENNTERREQTSRTIKKWQEENREQFLENNRKNAKLGGQASKLVKAKKIEYKGEFYLGWKELYDLTNVSKFLYNRFYLRGFDPEDRIGKDGPLPKNYVYKPLEEKENR
jgi:hypothetical protein